MNQLSNELKAQLFAQESADPFLTLVTLSGPGFTHRLVNNTVDIISNGQNYSAFPMKIRPPVDDGESVRDFQIEFDNVSLLLITALRTVTEPMDCQIDMILASIPDVVQMSVSDLKVQSVSYGAKKVVAKIVLDSFLTAGMTSERYTPSAYPGMF